MNLISILFNIDIYLSLLISQYGVFVYFLFFLVIFIETGIVIMPFLPGDSLIFAASTLAAVGLLNIFYVFSIILIAAILGDTINYSIGRYFGKTIINHGWIKQERIDKTQDFYEKHGGKTIILARFIPIIRTLAPFIAGLGKMNYSRFILYNVVGAFLWVSLFSVLGFFFGNITFVRDNFSLVIITIIILSFIPIIIEFIRNKKKK